MKRVLTIVLAIAVVQITSTSDSFAQLLNGSFESGAFSGWQLDIARGSSSSQPRTRPAGTAQVMQAWEVSPGSEAFQSATEGKCFAAIGSLASGNFIGNRSYHTSLSQSISLAAGEVITGWASFYNGDYEAQDAAWVKVFTANCELLATPWRENSGRQPLRDFNSTPYQTVTPWTQWFWQAPESGSYILSLGITTKGDNNFSSYGFFDGVWKTPAILPEAVAPEPSSFALALLGAVGLGFSRTKMLSRP